MITQINKVTVPRLCVCMYVCVCQRERERERERVGWKVPMMMSYFLLMTSFTNGIKATPMEEVCWPKEELGWKINGHIL